MTAVESEPTVLDVDFTQFVDARVKLTYDTQVDGEDVTEEAVLVVMAVNVETQVLMVRPKGKTGAFLVNFPDVHAIELDSDGTKVLKQKSLRLIKMGDARQHLLDRHGWPLEVVNGIDEVKAFADHEDIDHSILGHAHAEPVAAVASETTSEGSSEADAG